jgi:DNA polymerase/3'-5' exonuclease PolX
MSTGDRIPFAQAVTIASSIGQRLAPHVTRSKCVGSVRRRRDTIGDIEFVVEPRLVAADLFGNLLPDTASLRADVAGWSRWVKGGDRMWQVTDVFGREGLTLDLYFCWPPAEWGSIVAIRTGPWELGMEAVTRLRDAGTPHTDGHIPGHSTPEEEDFFRLAGLECRVPWERDGYAAELARHR